MRLIFMGTPAFAMPTLAALHDAGHEIVAVYSQPPRPAGRGQKETLSPVHTYAQKQGIPVLTPASLKSPEVQGSFAAHKADCAVVVAYGLLLPKAILEAYPLGCINVHPSLLPRWRGAAPLQRAIMAGDTETAIITMQMDAGMDTGDILLTRHFPIAPGTTTGMLADRLAQEAGPLVLQTLEGLKAKTLIPVKQPESGITHAKKITREEGRLDWRRPAVELYYQILGLSPSPGAYFSYNNEIIKVFEASHEASPLALAPGTVVDDALGIACGEGILRLRALQRPGKKRLEARQWLRGTPIPKGTVLPAEPSDAAL